MELLPLLLLTWALVYGAHKLQLSPLVGGLAAGAVASIVVHSAMVLFFGRPLQFVILSAIFYTSGAMLGGFFLLRERYNDSAES